MISPGKKIGMLGGGQLGRMSILAGRAMGYKFDVFDPNPKCAAGMVADKVVAAPFEDLEALKQFAAETDRVTLEFENIPAETVDTINAETTVYPGRNVLHICQHRRREKEFLRANNIPCAPFVVVHDVDGLKKAVEEIGTPCVLKTASFGYDGKGQIKITDSCVDLDKVWDDLATDEAVLEKWIRFVGECSVICARNEHGETACFPMAENIHTNHILDFSIVPSPNLSQYEAEARKLAEKIAEALDVKGLIAVELFATEEGSLIVNELAPRPHNSGHYTMDACATSQFEQHIRAVCGLPLGSTELLTPAVMVNILGDWWQDGEPDWRALLEEPNLKLHLYDKGEPKTGRKMGHLTLLGEDSADLLEKARKMKHKLAVISK